METSTFVPALRQSVESQMACEHGYGLVHIQGLKPPDTIESVRGRDVHEVLAPNARHCAQKRVPADFMYLDSLLDVQGDEAIEILRTCRDNIIVDWQNFLEAEVAMGLDVNMEPTYSYDHSGEVIPIHPVWGMEGSGLEPVYVGIADLILLAPGGLVAFVDDYKTHPRPFEADTIQGKRYALMVLMHLPTVQEVTFRLRFVRYANVVKQHTYYRRDVPQLIEELHRARARQKNIHRKDEQGETLAIHGGTHCTYCPAVLDNSCPILKLNPMLNLTPEERLNWRLVADVAGRVNDKAMQQHVEATGRAIQSIDGNGKAYTFGPVPKEKVTYPLFEADGNGGFTMPIVDALLDWSNANPQDLVPKKGHNPWITNLRIGSTQLKPYLKAKKRELIDNRIKDLAKKEQVVELRITRDAEIDDGKGEEHREFDADNGNGSMEF